MADGWTAADLIADALMLAGGEQSTADDVLSARRSLHLISSAWLQTVGSDFHLRRVRLPLVGETDYALPGGVDEIMDVIWSPNEDDGLAGLVPLTRMSGPEYARLSRLNQTGQPTQWYLERGCPPRLFVYPVASSGSLIIWHWYGTDFDPDSNTLNSSKRWMLALRDALAWDVAKKRPEKDEVRIARLKVDAEVSYTMAIRNDRSRAAFRVTIA